MKGSHSEGVVHFLLLIPLFAVLTALLITGILLRRNRALLAETEQAIEAAEEEASDLQELRQSAEEQTQEESGTSDGNNTEEEQ